MVLSHANILANVEQVRAHIAFYESDVVFDVSFLWSYRRRFHAIISRRSGGVSPARANRMKNIAHPPRTAPRFWRPTPSSLNICAPPRMATQRACAIAVCGAERVHDETRQLVKRKYAFARRLRCRGSRAGHIRQSAGREPAWHRGPCRAGVDMRIEPVEGIREGGRLMVKGPNVMLGYLNPLQTRRTRSSAGWLARHGRYRLDR